MNEAFEDDEDDDEISEKNLIQESLYITDNSKNTNETSEEILDFSFELTKKSLYDIINNNQDGRFRCHALARLGVTSLEQAKTQIESLLQNIRKNNSNEQSFQDKNRASSNRVDSRKSDNDFDSLSSQLESCKQKTEINDKYFENDYILNPDQTMKNSTFNENNIIIDKMETVKNQEDCFDLLDSQDLLFTSNKKTDDFNLLI